MPEISQFLRIVIARYFKDHNPPYFHVQYNEHRAQLLGGLRIGHLFGDGRGGQVDFTRLIDSDLPPVFAASRDPQTFGSFERAHGTLH